MSVKYIFFQRNIGVLILGASCLKIGGELSGANCPGGELSGYHPISRETKVAACLIRLISQVVYGYQDCTKVKLHTGKLENYTLYCTN